tara:strand:+ start:339 stop:1151 length:813 start_codon:yes stop_codon:yes gene_type:complete
MSMGVGLTIPNISNLPGVSRPGSGVQTDKYSLNFRTNESSQVRYTNQTITNGSSMNLWFRYTGNPLATGLLNAGVVLVGHTTSPYASVQLRRKTVDGENRILIRLSVQSPSGQENKDYISTNILNSTDWWNLSISYGPFLMRSEAEIDVYINGVKLTVDDEDTWTVNPQYSAFGNNRTNSTVSGFQGQITQFAQFGPVPNTILTAAQALAIYNNGKPTDLSSYNPTIWYELKEGPGANYQDQNYLANSGSLTNVNSTISEPGNFDTNFPS